MFIYISKHCILSLARYDCSCVGCCKSVTPQINTINKLLISLFENVIIFPVGLEIQRQVKYVAYQKFSVWLGTFKYWNHAGIFPDLKNFHTLIIPQTKLPLWTSFTLGDIKWPNSPSVCDIWCGLYCLRTNRKLVLMRRECDRLVARYFNICRTFLEYFVTNDQSSYELLIYNLGKHFLMNNT